MQAAEDYAKAMRPPVPMMHIPFPNTDVYKVPDMQAANQAEAAARVMALHGTLPTMNIAPGHMAIAPGGQQFTNPVPTKTYPPEHESSIITTILRMGEYLRQPGTNATPSQLADWNMYTNAVHRASEILGGGQNIRSQGSTQPNVGQPAQPGGGKKLVFNPATGMVEER
jgi:hypothetical protein